MSQPDEKPVLRRYRAGCDEADHRGDRARDQRGQQPAVHGTCGPGTGAAPRRRADPWAGSRRPGWPRPGRSRAPRGSRSAPRPEPGSPAGAAASRLATSKPSESGNWMSSSTRPGRIVRAASAASGPVAASVTVKPAGSSVPRANVRKPSWSSTIKIAADGRTRPVWHRGQPLASGQTLTTFPGWPARNSGRGPIWRAAKIPNVSLAGHQSARIRTLGLHIGQ